MRALLVSISLLVSPIAAGLAQPAISAETRAQLIAARDSVWRAWHAGDTTRLHRLLPSALAAGSPNGWDTRDRTITDAREFAARGARLITLQFDSTTISLRGRVAVVQARFTTVVEERGGNRRTLRGFATEVFVREQNGWVNPFWYLDDH